MLQREQDRLQGAQDRLLEKQDRLQDEQDMLQKEQYRLHYEQERQLDNRIGKKRSKMSCRTSRIGYRLSRISCRRSRIGTGRAERQQVEQNSLYGEHVGLKKEQDQLQDEQARLPCSKGNIGIQHFDIH